jgi:acetolactate synthase-1/2/3 large subunit
MGDLGFWYHMAEVETAVRAGINTITIINNNNSGNMAKGSISAIYDDQPTKESQDIWVQNKINFAKIAENMGAVGIRVEKANEIAPAFQKALKLGKPVVIDIATDIEVVAPKAWEPKT